MMFDSKMLDSTRYECVLLELVRTPDGQGGSRMTWVDGMKFDVVFEREGSADVLIAEQQGFTSSYKGYILKTMNLKFHDVLRRVSDGKIFRVTRDGDDNMTPNTSMLNSKCIVLERWELPTT